MQSTLEEFGLSDTITVPDPDLIVETEHHLSVPTKPKKTKPTKKSHRLDPDYELYQIIETDDELDEEYTITSRLLHNTLTGKVAVWISYLNHPRNLKDHTEVAAPYDDGDDWILDLMLPENRWYTHTPREYGKLMELQSRPVYQDDDC
jgi:hypothetical protein